MGIEKTAIIAAALVMTTWGAARALPIEDERYACVPLVRAAEVSHGIPDGLLEAIMWTESGYEDSTTGRRFPHPWMVSDRGRDQVFDTKGEAVEAAERLLRRGHRVLDVGCMQRNLYFHPDRAARSVSETVDPERNVQWAADYLVELYNGNGVSGGVRDYLRAAARFHRFVEDHEFVRYQRALETNWRKVRRERGLPDPRFASRTAALAAVSVNVLLPVRAVRPPATAAVARAPASRALHPARRSATQVAEVSERHDTPE